jgi:apolipoprotein N-acyltransferase
LPVTGTAGRRGQDDQVPWLRIALALGSGGLLNLAFPPHGAWWLAPIAIALLTGVVRDQERRTGAWLGLAHGLGFFVPLLVWTGATAGPVAWLALALLESGFFALLGWALAAISGLRGWPVWAALLWVAEEALRDRFPFGGFPWGRLAFSQGHTPLTSLAAIGGAPLVTLGVAAIGVALVSRPLLHRSPALLLAPVLLLLALVWPTPHTGTTASIAVVQGNVPRLGLPRADQQRAVLDNHVQATHDLAASVRAGRVTKPELVLWPENASDVDPYSDPAARASIDAAVRDIGVPVLVGAVTEGPGDKVSNRGIVWDPTTGAGESYVKRHPVPFGEYIPFRSLVRHVTSRVDLVPSDFASGTTVGTLRLGPVVVGDVICFEVAYDGIVRDVVDAGGQLLVVQTNNATFGRSGETTQQLAMGQLRAVEHGRSLVVAATSGVSAVIAPDGRVQHRTGIFTRDVTVQQVTLRDGTTLATWLGWWPELVMTVLALVGLWRGVRR